jgi:hypothetical protein
MHFGRALSESEQVVRLVVVDLVERTVSDPWEGVLIRPAIGTDVGVLVLAGSSGRVAVERARLLAHNGIAALAIRWCKPSDVREVPLESITAGVDLLRSEGMRRIGILGLSKGAEAALMTAVLDPRVDAVIALSPSSVVWGWTTAGSNVSSWTWQGRPLPYVPIDNSWLASVPSGEGPVAIRSWYEQSELTYASLVPAAEIPIERARADVLLVAGGDDAMWPSLPFAERLVARRRAAGLPVRLVAHPEAGHRPRFPGEDPPPSSNTFAYGGTPEADALLGAEAWPYVLKLLSSLS